MVETRKIPERRIKIKDKQENTSFLILDSNF